MQAGLGTLPFALANIAGAMIGPGMTTRLRPAVVVALGLGIAVAGVLLMAVTAGPDTPVAFLVAAFAVVGLGQGGAIALIADLIISSAPPSKTGSIRDARGCR